MSGIQYAGEYEIENLILFSSSGLMLPLNGLSPHLEIYENIFSSTITGSITLLDTNNLILNVPIIGQEYLSFKIKTASLGDDETGIIDYTKNVFAIYKIDARLKGTKSELLTLHFASPELLRNYRTRISKSYTNSIDKIVIDVLQNERYLNSKKELFIEGTTGVRKFVSPNSYPFTFMQKLATESISEKHKSPYFMFYENKDGFHFRSLDSLYSQPISAEYNTGEFFHQDRPGTTVPNVLDEYSRLINHQIVQSNDMVSNVRGGLLASNLITHNIYSKSYDKRTFRYFDPNHNFSRLSDNPIYNTNAIDEFGNLVDNFTDANIHLHPTSKVGESDAQHYTMVCEDVIPEGGVVETYQCRPSAPYSPNKIENSLLHRQAKFMELKRGVMLKVQAHGMTNMTVGQTIEIKMALYGAVHGHKYSQDPHYSGKYLITHLVHDFNEVPTKKHVITMTIVKDGYGKKLEQNTDAKEPKKRSRGTVHTNVA